MKQKDDALIKAIKSMSQSELQKTVLQVVQESPEVRRALMRVIPITPAILVSQPRNLEQVQLLKGKLNDFFSEAQYHFHDYDFYEAEEYEELDAVFQEAKLLSPIDQIDVYWYALKSGNELFDNMPLGTTNFEEAFRLYALAIAQLVLSPEQKQPYFDALVQALWWEMCGYGNVTNAIKTALDTIANQLEDYRYLIAKLKGSKAVEAVDWIAGYYLALNDDEKYLQIRKANLKSEHQYVELALYWQKKGKTGKYIETLEQWVLRIPHVQRTFGIYLDLSNSQGALDLLAVYYRKKLDDHNLCRILLVTARYDTLNLDLYKEVKEVAKRLTTWDEIRLTFIKLARLDPMALAQIYLYENEPLEAIRLAQQKDMSEGVITLIAEGVKEQYPKEAVSLNQMLVQKYIDHKGRESYREAAKLAKKVQDIYEHIMHDASLWQQYITQLRARYYNFSALQDEFRNL